MKKLIVIGCSVYFKEVNEKLKEIGENLEVVNVENEELVDLTKVKRSIEITPLPILERESLDSQLRDYTKQPKFQYEDKAHKDRMKYAKRKGR
jgi:hypothetical protein